MPLFNIRPLRTEADHRTALAAYERFFDDEPEPGTPEADAFELLGMVIAKFEEEHFPIAAGDPVATIELVMEAKGYKRSDLVVVLGGSRSRASEILNHKRDLSLVNIRALSTAWGIPAQNLIGEAPA